MLIYIQFLVSILILVICYQLYTFSVNKNGVDKQKSCQILGVLFMAAGITALIARQIPFVFVGLILIMLGFRLMAKGLDRIDKKIFIDRYDDEEIIEKENDNG